MSTTLPALAARTLTEDEARRLRAICDERQFSYGVFCGLIVRDVLRSPELTEKYIKITRQFEEDQRPASVEELKTLREKLRQQEEELEQLRALKQTMQNSAHSIGR